MGGGSVHAPAGHAIRGGQCRVAVVRRWAVGSCRDEKQRDPLKHQRGTERGRCPARVPGGGSGALGDRHAGSLLCQEELKLLSGHRPSGWGP